MGGAYGGRDRRIKRLMLSPDEKQRRQGLILLDQTFRSLVAGWLRFRADRYSVYASLLEPDVLADVWQQTLLCVWQNVQCRRFSCGGSLLSYLITIAKRRAIDRWRKALYIDPGPVPEGTQVTKLDLQIGLVEDFDAFYATLSEEDEMALRLDVQLLLENNGKWVTAEEFTDELNEVRRSMEWPEKTVQAVRTWRVRIRSKLRSFLRNRGYDE